MPGSVVPETFYRPSQAANPAEFWPRWHMPLLTWLRDYLFIPLGGSRVARPRVYLNLMITMALGGLWHGASWHFMVWDIYQGALLCGHRLWSATAANAQPYQRLMRVSSMQLVTRAGTLLLVCVGWVFFRADSMGGALAMLRAMGTFSAPALAGWHLEPLATPVLPLVAAALVAVDGWCGAVYKAPSERLVESPAGRVRAGRHARARNVLLLGRPAGRQVDHGAGCQVHLHLRSLLSQLVEGRIVHDEIGQRLVHQIALVDEGVALGDDGLDARPPKRPHRHVARAAAAPALARHHDRRAVPRTLAELRPHVVERILHDRLEAG